MTLSFSPGERRRLFLALCAIAFLGAVAIFVAALFNAKPAHAEVLAMPQSGSGWSACNRYGVCQWGDGALPGGPRTCRSRHRKMTRPFKNGRTTAT